ncbi:MAG: hypothetical protein H0V44_05625, partial [Planctomycetes bacterium]|nr:hypothetical protein [Planctomycetota bacterium]
MLRIIVLFVIASVIAAVDVVEAPPIGISEAIRALAALRIPLDRSPDDRQLLGKAMIGYVSLSLMGPSTDRDDAGPWLDHARQVAVLRRANHPGPAETFADALPEIMLAIAERDMVAAMVELDHWKTSSEDPTYRGCLALVTRDWRVLHSLSRREPIEDLALMRARYETGMSTSLFRVGKSIPAVIAAPYRQAVLDALAGDPFRDYGADAVRGVLAGIVIALGSSEIDLPRLRTLTHMLLGGVARDETDSSREALLARCEEALGKVDLDDGAAIARALAVLTQLAHGRTGFRALDGRHIVVGLGDVADWMRQRLEMTIYQRYIGARDLMVMGSDSWSVLSNSLLRNAPNEGLTSLIQAYKRAGTNVPLADLEREAENPQTDDKQRQSLRSQIQRAKSEQARSKPFLERLAANLARPGACERHSLRFLNNVRLNHHEQGLECPPHVLDALIARSVRSGAPVRGATSWLRTAGPD